MSVRFQSVLPIFASYVAAATAVVRFSFPVVIGVAQRLSNEEGFRLLAGAVDPLSPKSPSDTNLRKQESWSILIRAVQGLQVLEFILYSHGAFYFGLRALYFLDLFAQENIPWCFKCASSGEGMSAKTSSKEIETAHSTCSID